MIEDGTYTYEYNDFNQLSAIYDGEDIVEEYVYDHNGNRIAKRVYDGEEYVVTYYTNDQVVEDGEYTTYVRNGNTVLAEIGDETFYYHPDHLGSTTLITDEGGEVVNQVFYSPFGSVLDGDDEKYMYTSQELDDTGLQYYGARYYDSSILHFTQPDPIIADMYDPQNLNRFSYVRNNPYKYVDPSGNYIDTVVDVASISWSVHDIYEDPSNGWNWVALVADVGTLALPVVAGGGMAVRGMKIADKVDGVVDVTKLVNKVKISQKAVSKTERLQHAYKHAGELGLEFTGKSWKAEREAFTKLNENIIKNADEVFGGVKQARGGELTTVYVKWFDDKPIASYIFESGSNKEYLSKTIKLNENQLENLRRGVYR